MNLEKEDEGKTVVSDDDHAAQGIMDVKEESERVSSVPKEHKDMDIEQESEDNSSVTREEPDGAAKQSNRNLSKIE